MADRREVAARVRLKLALIACVVVGLALRFAPKPVPTFLNVAGWEVLGTTATYLVLRSAFMHPKARFIALACGVVVAGRWLAPLSTMVLRC